MKVYFADNQQNNITLSIKLIQAYCINLINFDTNNNNSNKLCTNKNWLWQFSLPS